MAHPLPDSVAPLDVAVDPADVATVKTLLLTDLADSVRLVSRVGDAPASQILKRHDRLARDLMARHGGREIDKTDGFLVLFERPIEAVRFALAYHRDLAGLAFELDVTLAARVGIHLGEVVLHGNQPDDVARGAKPVEVEGLAKGTTARLMSLAQGEQTLLTRNAFELARRATVGMDGEGDGELRWLAHGAYLFRGLDDPVEVFEVGFEGRSRLAPPADSLKAWRVLGADEEITLGWRPAAGQQVVHRRHWILHEKLGEGGFGEVWLAVHETTGEKRVFKFCHSAEHLRTLRREVTLFRVLREALGHRHDIARILDWNFEESPYFLESEYTEGGNLLEWAQTRGGIAEVSLEQRLELMAQVAEALDAAHSTGVLHKDVKPGNVLITTGRDGEPRAVLTDFGIGLLTDRGVLAAHGITALGLTELMATTHPSAGTRTYMAPELVEGKPPTIQADIYGLAVMIYQVVAGDLTRSVAPGWERDVDNELLVEDLAEFLDHAPERRPRSAAEVADRLRRLEERRAERQAERRARLEERRARRRRKVLTTAAAVAGVFLIVVSIFAFQAQRARREAEIRRAQAESLITFMLQDLRLRLQEVGQLEMLDEVGAKALEYFAALPPGPISEVEEARRAFAFNLIGEVRLSRGDLDPALDAFEQARAIGEQLTAAEGGAAEIPKEWRGILGASHYWIGHVHWRRRELDQAAPHFERFLELSERLMEEEPDEPKWRRYRGFSLVNIGWLHREAGDLETALEYYRAALELKRELVEEYPENSLYRRDLAANYNLIASMLDRLGQLREARDLFQADLAIKRELALQEPDNSRWQIELSTSLNLTGQVLEAMGESDAALEHYRAAVAVLETWVEKTPSNSWWQRHLAVNDLRLGHLLLRRGAAEEARRHFERANGVMRRLVEQEPTQILWQRDLARTHRALGEADLDLPRRALEKVGEAVGLLESLLAEHPEDRPIRRRLAESYILQGRVQAGTGDATEAFDKAVEVLEVLVADSSDWRLLAPFTEALLHLGRHEEARPPAEKLTAIGYREPRFLELCRSKRLCSDKDVGSSSTEGEKDEL